MNSALADAMVWRHDWAVGLALTMATVTLHVIGLELIWRAFTALLGVVHARTRRSVTRIVAVMSPTAALILMLHAFEAVIWAVVYVRVEALPRAREAMLYSLGAVSTYGHAPVYLAADWQLLGAIQALNGMLTFGLTIAFMTAVLRRVWTDSPL